MKANYKNSIGEILLLTIVIALSFKIFPAWFPPLRKEWQFMAIAMVVLFVLNGKKILNNNSFVVYTIFSLFFLLRAYMGTFLYPSISFAIHDILMLLMAVFFPLYVLQNNNQSQMKYVLYITFILLIFETIASYFFLQTTPGAIRSMNVLLQEEGSAEVFKIYRVGLADYGQCHALPVMIPPLFYVIKNTNRKIIKWSCVLGIGVCLTLTWMSEATTALLLALLMLVLGLFTNRKSSKTSLVIIFLIFVPFIISDYLQLTVLDFLDKVLSRESVFGDKLAELRYSVTHDQTSGDLDSRMNRYGISLEQFITHPLFGSSQAVGRHSAILDRLATFGLVGFIPLVLFFYSALKQIYYYIPERARMFYIEAIMAGFIMLLAKNMWLWSVFFFMFIALPLLLVYDFEKDK